MSGQPHAAGRDRTVQPALASSPRHHELCAAVYRRWPGAEVRGLRGSDDDGLTAEASAAGLAVKLERAACCGEVLSQLEGEDRGGAKNAFAQGDSVTRHSDQPCTGGVRAGEPLPQRLGPDGGARGGAGHHAAAQCFSVTAVDRSGAPLVASYDRLVLATGSRVIRPQMRGAEHLFEVDTPPKAAVLKAHLHRLSCCPPRPASTPPWLSGPGSPVSSWPPSTGGPSAPARGDGRPDARRRLTDTDGHPLAGAKLDIWRADADGRYSSFMPGSTDRQGA